LNFDFQLAEKLQQSKMAGGGEGGAWDYPYDESKYRGIWRYLNTETPRGRYGCAYTTLAMWAAVFAYFKFRSKSKKAIKK